MTQTGTDTDKAFSGSIPELYEALLVPLLFEHLAEDMAARAAATSPRAVLEIAAGTGVVTRRLAPRLPGACYVATDLNQPMLDVAMAKQPSGGAVAWKQADAQALPFEDAAFDTVICQFGAMFFPDRVGAYAEARRVLKPQGRFLFNVWDRIGNNEFAAIVTEALAALWPDDPPRFLARTPHGYHDEARIQSDLTEAGFAGIALERNSALSRAPSALHVARAYCEGTPLRSEIEAKGAGSLQSATAAAASALAARFGSGEVSGCIAALVIEASQDA